MEEYFFHDTRLGIPIPSLQKDWDHYCERTQQSILLFWEGIRGRIPEQISLIEEEISHKLTEMSDEHDFKRTCRLNAEIAELASIITDLLIWYRKQELHMDNKVLA
jgi:hypothetical protein